MLTYTVGLLGPKDVYLTTRAAMLQATNPSSTSMHGTTRVVPLNPVTAASNKAALNDCCRDQCARCQGTFHSLSYDANASINAAYLLSSI